jgi:LacI family transcriptional regulator
MKKNIKVPAIAVIGFVMVCVRIITPKLSTVEQPSYEMGVVISLLLEEMQCNKENKISNLR